MNRIIIHKHKNVDECAEGGASAPISTLDNVGGMGNPIPPSENNIGSGDAFGNVSKMSTQKPAKTFKIKYLKKKKHV